MDMFSTTKGLPRLPLLALIVLFAAGWMGFFLVCGSNRGSLAAVRRMSQTGSQATPPRRGNVKDRFLIEPGKGIGPLELGDTMQRTLELFEPEMGKGEKIQTDECGPEYIWLDSEGRPLGNFSVRFQDYSVVSQIESGTPRYHTAEGITAYDSLEKVRRHYRGLRTYAVMGNSPMAFGGGPLIYWIDWTRGIAFFLASTRRDHQRYLYSIIVFKPGGTFCPER